MTKIAKSVPDHLVKINPDLWYLPSQSIEWKDFDLTKSYIISGSAFIDLTHPYGTMGNPFAVVIGNKIKNFDIKDRHNIGQITGTPETVFINDYSLVNKNSNKNIYTLNLTVNTPLGKELGACAHGFTGAIQTLLEFGLIMPNSEVAIQTTLDTTAHVSISDQGVIALQFKAEKPITLSISTEELTSIFNLQILDEVDMLPVLSVGSPKLIIELPRERFTNLQKKP